MDNMGTRHPLGKAVREQSCSAIARWSSDIERLLSHKIPDRELMVEGAGFEPA
jgi:hypothetical protein